MDTERAILLAFLFIASLFALVMGLRGEWPPADGTSVQDVSKRSTKLLALVGGTGGLLLLILVLTREC